MPDSQEVNPLYSWRRLAREVRPYWGYIGLSFTASMLAAPFALLLPLPLIGGLGGRDAATTRAAPRREGDGNLREGTENSGRDGKATAPPAATAPSTPALPRVPPPADLPRDRLRHRPVQSHARRQQRQNRETCA